MYVYLKIQRGWAIIAMFKENIKENLILGSTNFYK